MTDSHWEEFQAIIDAIVETRVKRATGYINPDELGIQIGEEVLSQPDLYNHLCELLAKMMVSKDQHNA